MVWIFAQVERARRGGAGWWHLRWHRAAARRRETAPGAATANPYAGQPKSATRRRESSLRR
jgi:hypothetical protein